MINANMREYDYCLYGENDAYGVPSLTECTNEKLKMAIEIASQSIQDSILYSGCSYVGLTHDSAVNDKMVVMYGDEKLKIQYVNPRGRYIQVFMERM